MWFTGGRRLLYPSMVVLLVVTVFQNMSQVEAIRVFPSNAEAEVKFSFSNVDKKNKEDLLYKYFSGRTFGLGNTTQKGFDESKRRVPSSPDPLHN
ncbi:hypothetical protein TanjilG_15158 [Lupinus angustifolius]|uniref:Uncharacterized protein n=1 Tax=Lupinus angustifolius TaxID=3871 RepID=A0A1J7HP98_LUPAN|nr:PREDICTED: CLAVATA3/ESR (CLE)-related protein 43 [Lupinus angustifolius]OIW02275.1 hypothetical protein TanjilG_15158 [Lupinus angustifolius]